MRGKKRIAERTTAGALRRLASPLTMMVALPTSLVAMGSPAAAADPPYTCKSGFVWREAYVGDLICVTPAIRTQSAIENALGPSRREPHGGPYGPATCRQGFVWRETRPSDLVCVPPGSRTQAYSDNAAAAWRVADPGALPYGGISVTTGFHRLGGHLYANGRGLTPQGTARFYAVVDSGLNELGRLTAGADGALTRWAYVADIRCRGGQTGPATVVVLDQKTGVVTTAGTTDAYRHCG